MRFDEDASDIAARLVARVKPEIACAPWEAAFELLIKGVAEELARMQTRPEPGSRFVAVYQED